MKKKEKLNVFTYNKKKATYSYNNEHAVNLKSQ